MPVTREQQGGVAGLVASIQGVAAVIAPLLSTSLYLLDKHAPFAFVATFVLLVAVTMLVVKNKSDASMKTIES